MNRRITAVALALALAAPLAAQQATQSKTATASVTVLPNLTLVKNTDLAFGSHLAGASYVQTTPATWSGTTDTSNAISISFGTLPTVLTSGASTVPFSCGTTSGLAQGGASDLTFNPNTGVASYVITGIIAGGGFNVVLGQGATAGTTACSVNLAGAKPSATPYTATITLTVSVL